MAYDYPLCRADEYVENWFGRELTDPYGWMRDAKEPEVIDFTERENAFTDAFFDPDALAARMEKLKSEAVRDIPFLIVPRGEGFLATVMHEGLYDIRILDRELREVCTLPTVPGLEGSIPLKATPCPKNPDVIAVCAEFGGAPRPSVAVCDISDPAAPKLLHLHEGSYSFCWSAGDGCLYYPITTSENVNLTSRTVYYRYDPVSGELRPVFEPEGNVIYANVSAGGSDYVLLASSLDYALARWVALEVESGALIPLNEKPEEWKFLNAENGEFFFTSAQTAPHGAVIAVDKNGAQRTVLPEHETLVLDGGFAKDGNLFALAYENAGARLIDVATGKLIPLPDPYGALTVAGGTKEGTFLRFESFLHAAELFLFDGEKLTSIMRSSELELPDDIVVEQRFAPSEKDGTPVPFFMVRKRGLYPAGNAPALMFAYGGYNLVPVPWYTEKVTGTQIWRWVEKGGIYLHAHLRGGNEYGAPWHEDGELLNKRHCYEDFIGVAEHVIREGWTKPERFCIAGSSNGGLLMSTLITMRPDLWGCVIDSVPQTDLIHLPDDDRGPMYVTEYGNPRETQEMFEYLLSFTPYYNVKPISYPPLYIQSGALDNNVPPYHGKKFAARMQQESRSENPILLRVVENGGHDRGRGESYWRTISEAQLFLEKALHLDA